MFRNRVVRLVSLACCVPVTVIYAPVLIEVSEKLGFWFLSPVWACFIVGLVTILEWMESRLEGSRDPSPEIHNANFPVPSVRAIGWDVALLASEASVDEAFRKTKGRGHGIIGLVREDRTELVVWWKKRGWTVESVAVGSGVRNVAVNSESDWAGKEVRLRSRRDVLFKRMPEDWFDESTAKAIVGSFLGWNDLPREVVWVPVRYP